MELIIVVVIAIIILFVAASRGGSPGDKLISPSGEYGTSEFHVNEPISYGHRPPIIIGYWNNDSDAETVSHDHIDPKHDHSKFSGSNNDAKLNYNPPDKDDTTVRAKQRRFIQYDGERHLITIGSTRSGKGSGSLIPNLYNYGGSIVVIDPKGENTRHTAEHRRSIGQDVFVIDPWNITNEDSCGYNPICSLVDSHVYAVELSRLYADAIVVPSSSVTQIYWEEEARNAIATAILFISTKKDGNLCELIEIFGNSNENIRSFFQKLSTLSQLSSSTDDYTDVIRRGGLRFLNKSSSEFSGVLSTVRKNIVFLESSGLRKCLSRSDFSFADIRSRKSTIYIVIPVLNIELYKSWLRLMITSALNDFMRTDGYDQSVLMMIDEFASIGPLKYFEMAFSLVAGSGVQLWPMLQDISQLRSLYQETAGSFLANAGVIQYMGSNDIETAEYISSRMGLSTIAAVEKSVSVGDERVDTVANRLMSRPLMMPDEILRIDQHKQILLVESEKPIISDKIRYYEDSEFDHCRKS